MGFVSNAWNKVTGAGTSSFKPENYQYDESAFQDPYLKNNLDVYGQRIADSAPSEQNDFAKAIYQNAMNPNAPSVAQNQLAMGEDANVRNAYGMAAGANASGVNPGLAYRNAMDTAASSNAQTNGQMGVLRAQESQNSMANALREQQLQNNTEQYYRTLGYNEEQASLAAKQDLEKTRGNAALSRSQIAEPVALANSKQRAQNISGIISGSALGVQNLSSMGGGGGGGGGGSDLFSSFSSEDEKYDIKPETSPSASKYDLGIDTKFDAPERAPDPSMFSASSSGSQITPVRQSQDSMTPSFTPASDNSGPVDIYGKMFTNISGGSGSSDKKDSGGGGGGMMSTVMKLAPLALAAFSDETMKKDKHAENGSSNDLYHFLDAIQAYKYKYKNPDLPGAGHGDHYSVMAQDLEKTPVGESMVDETPQGKMVDYGKGFGAMLASMAQMHDRVKALEGKGR